MSQTKNLFADIGQNYATYRPSYPDELGEALTKLCKNKQLALDVGCGTGQLTAILSQYFDQVIGTDINSDQLKHAHKAENITYLHEGAEETSLENGSVDLIVVAQAAHWFDLKAFYKEVERISTDDGIIALVSYGVPYIESATSSVFQQGYWQLIHQYWPEERKHVEEGYLNLDFPFEEIDFPELFIHREMNYDTFIGYMKTWSAYKTAQQSGDLNSFKTFFGQLEQAWEDRQTIKTITWPISVRVAQVN